jgi:hypothetical protein
MPHIEVECLISPTEWSLYFFQTPMDCDYKPNDIVPIAVGVALALLVITVLISYLVNIPLSVRAVRRFIKDVTSHLK